MGSGDKFRIETPPSNYWSLGFSYVHNGEHEHSFHLDLIWIRLYVGIGKGYDQR